MGLEILDPRILIPRYSADAVRYILLREIPFGSDGNYSTELFLTTINSDLANNYGNLVSRTFSMLKKYRDSVVPQASESAEEIDINLKKLTLDGVLEVKKCIESNFDVSKALANIFDIFSAANKYIEDTEPYRLAKDESKSDRLNTVLRNLLEVIRIGTVMLSAFLPDCSKVLLSALSVKNVSLGNEMDFYGLNSGDRVGEIPILFPRLDIQKELDELREIEENRTE